MKIYLYDKSSGKYIGEREVPDDLEVPNSLPTKPPSPEHHQSGGEWVLSKNINVPTQADIDAKEASDKEEFDLESLADHYKEPEHILELLSTLLDKLNGKTLTKARKALLTKMVSDIPKIRDRAKTTGGLDV